MPQIIRNHNNENKPIIDGHCGLLSATYFNLLRLERGQTLMQRADGFETVYVVLSGNCDISVAGHLFEDVGKRKDVWSGNADAVYAGAGAEVAVRCNTNGTEIAVAGGKYDRELPPFRISPEENVMVDVGSVETKTHRRIFHILGTNTKGRTGNLLVSELYADEGCWSGYPPHKHDEERGAEETAFEEVYHYRFMPDEGFGVQVVFQGDGSSECFMVKNADTCLIDRGYHPMAASPGHRQYVFTILAGKNGNSLIQNFKEEYRHLMKNIPGISDMREKFL